MQVCKICLAAARGALGWGVSLLATRLGFDAGEGGPECFILTFVMLKRLEKVTRSLFWPQH